MSARVEWVWGDERELVVEHEADSLRVQAHPGLSQAQVAAACAHLGEQGPVVMSAWSEAMGLTD